MLTQPSGGQPTREAAGLVKDERDYGVSIPVEVAPFSAVPNGGQTAAEGGYLVVGGRNDDAALEVKVACSSVAAHRHTALCNYAAKLFEASSEHFTRFIY